MAVEEAAEVEDEADEIKKAQSNKPIYEKNIIATMYSSGWQHFCTN